MYENLNQPEEMKQRYEALPLDIIDLFEQGTVDVTLENTAKEFGLTDDQGELLRMEVELVLYLFLPKNGLAERIKESLELDDTKSEQIANKIETDLFVIVDNILAAAVEQLMEGDGKNTTDTTEYNKNTETNPVSTIKTVSPIDSTVPETTTDTPSSMPNESATNVRPLRTFAEDVEISRAHSYGAFRSGDEEQDNGDGEPVYHSSQDDIIKR